MQVYRVSIESLAIGPLSTKLKSSLLAGPTLWLVSGGSNIPLSVAVMQNIDTSLSANLTIGLVDERYGSYGHPDSNWAQLKQAGFEPKKAKMIEPLRTVTASLEESTKVYGQELNAALLDSQTAIGQFGMGSDGHIAGILPGSVAAKDDDQLVIAYQSDPFIRITVTFETIRRLNTAFLMAFGSSKKDQLTKLVEQDIPLSDQPAQIIKQVSESYIYNDQIGGNQ